MVVTSRKMEWLIMLAKNGLTNKEYLTRVKEKLHILFMEVN